MIISGGYFSEKRNHITTYSGRRKREEKENDKVTDYLKALVSNLWSDFPGQGNTDQNFGRNRSRSWYRGVCVPEVSWLRRWWDNIQERRRCSLCRSEHSHGSRLVPKIWNNREEIPMELLIGMKAFRLWLLKNLQTWPTVCYRILLYLQYRQ